VTPGRVAIAIAIGVAAGAASGLLGVGGGIAMIPLLIAALGFPQHRAHATSLAAIILIAAAGATRFALDGSIDLWAAGFLAAGSLVGAPFGARALARIKERPLKLMFGVLSLAVAVLLAFGTGTG
jgi:uncharacterized membrane protein YfcA